MPTSNTPDWRRLATAVKARRNVLRLSFYGVRMAGGPSHATMVKIEKGEEASISNETKTKLETAFGWTVGSVDRILDGGDPALALPEGTAGDAEVVYAARGEQVVIDIVSGLGGLSDADRREILALIRAKQDRDSQ